MSGLPMNREDDDGFSAPSSGHGVNYLKWTAGNPWVDRNGSEVSSRLLATSVSELVRRWEDGRPISIFDRPLPNPDELNSKIPESEWELGLDGKPRPPCLTSSARPGSKIP